MDDTLRIIANVARNEMEAFARVHGGSFEPDTLETQCGISSYFLIELAKKFNYKLTLVEGVAFSEYGPPYVEDMCNHCWVEYKDYIIDITATQFNLELPKVHITKINDNDYHKLNINEKVYNSYYYWPEQQVPNTYYNELNERVKYCHNKLIKLLTFIERN